MDDRHRDSGTAHRPHRRLRLGEGAGASPEAVMKRCVTVNADVDLTSRRGERGDPFVGDDRAVRADRHGQPLGRRRCGEYVVEVRIQQRFAARQVELVDAERRSDGDGIENPTERQHVPATRGATHVAMTTLQVASAKQVHHERRTGAPARSPASQPRNPPTSLATLRESPPDRKVSSANGRGPRGPFGNGTVPKSPPSSTAAKPPENPDAIVFGSSASLRHRLDELSVNLGRAATASLSASSANRPVLMISFKAAGRDLDRERADALVRLPRKFPSLRGGRSARSDDATVAAELPANMHTLCAAEREESDRYVGSDERQSLRHVRLHRTAAARARRHGVPTAHHGWRRRHRHVARDIPAGERRGDHRNSPSRRCTTSPTSFGRRTSSSCAASSTIRRRRTTTASSPSTCSRTPPCPQAACCRCARTRARRSSRRRRASS